MQTHKPKVLAAMTGNKEFDPTTETHHFGFVVKVVNPGCTLELQIEEADGRVTRLTTTDNRDADRKEFSAAVLEATKRMFDQFKLC